jgi:hypothetical protein
MKKIVLALGIVACLATTATAADVINGCYLKANGQFRILLPGDSCLASEVTVSFRSATDTSGLTPEVYDANGQFLGVGMIDELYIPSLRKWTLINLRDASGDIWNAQLYFTSPDCSGQPHAEYENLHRIFRNGQGAARKYYTAAPEVVDPAIIINSYLEGEGNCFPIDTIGFAPAVSRAVEVTLPFTVPIALPTRIVAPKTGLAGRLAR